MEQASDVINKELKRLYFSVQLKRARVLHCLYTLCSYVRGTRLFLCPAKVPKRQVRAS